MSHKLETPCPLQLGNVNERFTTGRYGSVQIPGGEKPIVARVLAVAVSERPILCGRSIPRAGSSRGVFQYTIGQWPKQLTSCLDCHFEEMDGWPPLITQALSAAAGLHCQQSTVQRTALLYRSALQRQCYPPSLICADQPEGCLNNPRDPRGMGRPSSSSGIAKKAVQ